MDTERFIIYIKTDDICKNIGENVETRFDTSNYESQRPLPKRKNKKLLRLMKDDFGRKSNHIYLIKKIGDKESKSHKKVCDKKET